VFQAIPTSFSAGDWKDAVMRRFSSHAKMNHRRRKKHMGSATILNIEDNFDNRMLIRCVLMAEVYEIIETGNAGEGLEVLKSLHPDLILMDINLPDMDGYTLTARIRSLPGFESVPIVALTANVMRGDRVKSLEAGCDGYIQKPIDIDLLPQQVEHYIKEKINMPDSQDTLQNPASDTQAARKFTIPKDCTAWLCRTGYPTLF
jgi:two-component system cell cycle response regulator DivK